MKKSIVMAMVLAFCLVGSVQAQVSEYPARPKPPVVAPAKPTEQPKRVKNASPAEKREAERKLEKFIDRMNAIEDKQVFGR